MTHHIRSAERRRIRALASDARAGSWARGKARTAQREFVRQNWWVYTAATAVLLALTTTVSFMMPTSFLSGLVLGSFLVGGGAALWMLTVQVTGTAPVMMGDTAEMWTAMELRRLQIRGWRVVNHMLLAKDDLDHVLVGPGGVYVVETKWSASSWQSEFGRSRVKAAVAQATANARSLGLWHPVKTRGVPVRPVVVLWGGGPNRQERIVRDGDTTIVTGKALRTWLDRLGADVLSEEQIADVWQALDSQIALRDPADRAANPVPTSVATMLARFAIAASAAILGFFLVGRVYGVTDSIGISVGVGAASLVPGALGVRAPSLRPAAWGWLVGVGLPVVALALARLMSLPSE